MCKYLHPVIEFNFQHSSDNDTVDMWAPICDSFQYIHVAKHHCDVGRLLGSQTYSAGEQFQTRGFVQTVFSLWIVASNLIIDLLDAKTIHIIKMCYDVITSLFDWYHCQSGVWLTSVQGESN